MMHKDSIEKYRRRSIFFVGVCAFLVSTGCGRPERKVVTIEHPPYEKIAYETVQVQRGELRQELELKLRQEGYHKITYDAANGELQLDTVYVTVGDKVEQGDLLVSFQSESIQQKIDSYREQYTQKQLLVEHYTKLMQIDSSLDYREDISRLKQDIEVAKLYMEEAEEKLSRYQIVAKESGTITEMDSYLQNGTFVPGRSLITQVCGSGKYQTAPPEDYAFDIGERYSASVGQVAYELEVSEINENAVVFTPVSDISSVSDADTLVIVIQPPVLHDVVYVNAEAVKEADELYYVYVQDEEGYREAVKVTIGERVAGQLVITSGLSGGEKVTLN